MIYRTVAAALLITAANAELYTSDETHQKFMWEQFKEEFGKAYETMSEEYAHFKSFVENLKISDERNLMEKSVNGTAVHGITKFSDLSQEEFASRYLLSNPNLRSENRETITLDPPSLTSGLIDWSSSNNPLGHSLTTAVKDQGYCGSCWAFSATEQIESDAIREHSKTYVLSPEQIVQCDHTSSGCNGGWTEHAYNYVKGAGGLEQNSDYPYTSYQGTTGSCKSLTSSKQVVTITGYHTVSGESSMASWVQKTGPLSVCVDASTWNSYKGGIMSSCGNRVDHCVQAVGVDTSSYWKVRNSWGTSWGESGYIRLAYGHNTCAITNDPTYTATTVH